MELTTKQKRFVDEYVADPNATQAYKRAGYKGGQAHAARLYANPAVRAAIDAKLALLAQKTGLTAEKMWRESGFIALSNIADVIDFTGTDPKLKPANQIPEAALRAIKSVKVKRYLEGTGEEAREVQLLEFTFWDKPGEIHTRLKALGELKETVEHTGRGGRPIEAEINFIDVNAKILSFAAEFREAARRNLQEAAEAAGNNGHSHDGSQTNAGEQEPGAEGDEETPRADDPEGGGV